MRALVTGGAGFIGAHVVRALLAEGVDVRVLHLAGEDLSNLQGLECERLPGDVRDPATLGPAVRSCDWVFHLAALYALWTADPERMRQVNVEGTRNVLRAAADAGARKVVHTSTIAVFGGQGLDRDATEQSPFRLADSGDPYCLTKYEAHQVALEFARSGLDVSIVAPCGPIGPGDVGPTPTGRFLLAAVRWPISVCVHTIVNFVDVRDVAAGHVAAARRGRRGESYLLGAENRTYRELLATCHRLAGVWRPVVPVPGAIASIGGSVLTFWADHVSGRAPLFTRAVAKLYGHGLRADASKAARELELTPRPVDIAVRDALRWFAERGYLGSGRLRQRLLDRLGESGLEPTTGSAP